MLLLALGCATASQSGYEAWSGPEGADETDFAVARTGCFQQTMRVDNLLTPVSPRRSVTVDEDRFRACMAEQGWTPR